MTIPVVIAVIAGGWWLDRAGLGITGYALAVAVGGFVITLMTSLRNGVWGRSTAQRAADVDVLVERGLTELAMALDEQWREEEAVRGAGDSWPLPVRFEVPEYAASVMVEWSAIRGDPDGEPLHLEGAYTQFADVFSGPDSPRRLVVLGEPGAGKSLMVLRLTLDLLAQRGEHGPVPVLLPVASWDPKQPLEDWVAERLATDYPMLKKPVPAADGSERTLARTLVARRRILPVLDGLDEMADENRGDALELLSHAARRGYQFVLTCRTREYRQVAEEYGAMARTPVIELKPLTMSDVHAYLRSTTTRNPDKWDRLLRHAQDEPDGPAATALSTPLVVWLASKVYRHGDNDPGELLEIADADAIIQHLLDGLIPAAYSYESTRTYPKRGPEHVRGTYSTLIALARHLRAENTENLAWWGLYRKVPRLFLAPTAGIVVALPSAIACGLALRLDSAWYGLAAAVAFGLVLGVCGGASAVHYTYPRVLTATFGRRQLRNGLLGGILVGPAFGIICALTFGNEQRVLSGLTAGLAIGITGWLIVQRISGMLGGIDFGAAAGVVFGFAAYLTGDAALPELTVGLVVGVPAGLTAIAAVGVYQQAETAHAISPSLLLRGDRLSILAVAPLAGTTVGATYALPFGVAAGIAAGVATTVGLVFAANAWGISVLVRLLLAVTGDRMPLRLMSFLGEAHARGILRQSGGFYQFRHRLLHERLSALSEPPSATDRRPAARS